MSQTQDGFIQHKVLKTDTLAGLAVKYGITVSDIKRANGLLSDSAMFAREYIKIPTAQLPLSEDAQVLFARLLSGYGRDASLNAKERKAPGSVAVVQLPGSPIAGACCSEEDDTGTPFSRRSSEPGEVEMMERSGGGAAAAAGGGGGYGSDRVRRRNRAGGADAAAAARQNASAAALAAAGAIGAAADAAIGWLAESVAAPPSAGPSSFSFQQQQQQVDSSSQQQQQRRRFAVAPPPGARQAGLGLHRDSPAAAAAAATWQHLSSATTNLVDKIKRVASQPALGANGGGAPGANRQGLREAADYLLLPRAPRAPGAGSAAGGGGGSMDILSRGLPPSAIRKGGAKDD